MAARYFIVEAVRQPMTSKAHILALLLTALCLPAASAAPPTLCKALRRFAASVQPNEKREFTFRTSWGSNFTDAKDEAFFAKRCTDAGYEPAKKVCDYLMNYGAVEFSNSNVEEAISCLSKTKFDLSLRRFPLHLRLRAPRCFYRSNLP